MSDWFDVARADEIPPGCALAAEVEGVFLAVVNVDGEFFVVEDLCTHDGGDLATGDVEGDEIVCPRHGARFCVRTGEVKAPPAYEAIRAFPARVEGGVVQVRLPGD
jgi:3-phenylpropionate/trans-cinnamate dioxygenase ferredoxin subunit